MRRAAVIPNGWVVTGDGWSAMKSNKKLTEQGLLQLTGLVRLEQLDLEKCCGVLPGAEFEFLEVVWQQKLQL
jgi:hypothetical protein